MKWSKWNSECVTAHDFCFRMHLKCPQPLICLMWTTQSEGVTHHWGPTVTLQKASGSHRPWSVRRLRRPAGRTVQIFTWRWPSLLLLVCLCCEYLLMCTFHLKIHLFGRQWGAPTLHPFELTRWGHHSRQREGWGGIAACCINTVHSSSIQTFTDLLYISKSH